MSSGKMNCANCGNEVREGARFCASCGAPVVQAAAEPSRAEPPPPPSPGGKRRLRWVAIGVAVALLVAGGAAAAALSLTGGDGTNQATPTEGDSESTSIGADCEQLTAYVEDFAPALSVDPTDLGASAELIDGATEALSELASGAPADVREDIDTVSEAWQGIAQAVSDLGLEPGDVPDDEQLNQILVIDEEWFDNPEFLDASVNVADWLEPAVAQCSSTDTETTEATETGDAMFGDETTTEAGAASGDDVDEACAGFVTLATLTREENPDPSVADVESLAAIASELASNAPAETFEDGTLHIGQPKQSLDAIAQGLEAYARLLTELGLEPGSDEALDEPRIADVIDGLEEADPGLTSWFEDRCSEEDMAAFERIRNG